MSLDLAQGEIVAVVGENGAGKSTLMNVLYGLYRPDAGEIVIRGEPVQLRGPGDAIRRGIGMVHQHFMLVPPLTVAENVVMGREPRRFGVLLDFDLACEQVKATCARFGFDLDPRARIEDLSVGSQQKVEIVKALHRGAEVVILDEPTAVLTPQEADELFAVLRQLASQGHAVVLISHKLRHVLSVAQRVAVMRRGRMVAEVRSSETNVEQLAELMVGPTPVQPPVQVERSGEVAESKAHRFGFDSASGYAQPERDQRVLELRGVSAIRSDGTPDGGFDSASGYAQPERGQRVLELRGVSAVRSDGTPALRDVNLDVFAGEIVGIAGVDGNGQRELAEVLTGVRRATGSARLLGREILNASPDELRELGVGHVPEDRLQRAIVGSMSVEENLALGRHRQPPFARGVRIDFKGRRAKADALMAHFDVRPRDPRLRIAELSGGNQQKVVLARELEANPKLLVVVQPTRGLDIAAVASVHARLRDRRAAGAGIVLVSLDFDEVLALSDRIYVFFDGRVVGELQRAEFDERRIGRMILGAADVPPPATPPTSEAAHG